MSSDGPPARANISADVAGLECLCGMGDSFERVVVQRLPHPAIVTDFVACTACSTVFYRPLAQMTKPTRMEDINAAAKDYKKPGRR